MGLTNWLVVAIGLIGFVDYVLLYDWAKRHTPFSTLIGCISGSASIIAGYAAYTHYLDLSAWLLFAILVLWQVPHFYALGLYRRQDYAAAGMPIIPVVRTARTTQWRALGYIVVLLLAVLALLSRPHASVVCVVLLAALCGWWLLVGIRSLQSLDAASWGKRLFLMSLVVNIGLSLAIGFGSIVP
jgi:protoheme IX farnesyltransferase